MSRRTRRHARRPIAERLEDRHLLSVYVVTSAEDSGAGTLRQAIVDANGNAGADQIHFNIPGTGTRTIALLSALPEIDDPVTIDGATQPGYSGTPVIDIDGANAGTGANGLTIAAGNSTINGLAITNFRVKPAPGTDFADFNRGGAGIELTTGGGNVITGDFLGTNPAGNANQGNSYGLLLLDSADNTIGGTSAATRNVISGNSMPNRDLLIYGAGLAVTGAGSTGNLIQGNEVGTDPTGSMPLGNNSGVMLYNANSNTIGGTTAGARNLVSGQLDYQIWLTHNAASNLVADNFLGTDATGTAALDTSVNLGVYGAILSDGATANTIGGTSSGARNIISGNAQGVVLAGPANLVQGNYIGTDPTGTAAVPNRDAGVEVTTPGNTIGGTSAAEANLISGNGSAGTLQGFGVWLNNPINIGGSVVQGNRIGTDVSGARPLGNQSDGVHIDGSGNTVGGTSRAAGNVIADNGMAGVAVESGTGNAILSNLIHDNAGLGIDLISDVIRWGTHLGTPTPNFIPERGVTSNTPAGSSSGPNNLQNYPVITNVGHDTESTTVAGTLDSTPNTTFTLQVFANNGNDPTGFGQGQLFLGQTTATTDAAGHASFNTTFSVPTDIAPVITATATDPAGNTSEFARDVPAPPVDLTLTAEPVQINDGSLGTAFIRFTVTNSGTATATNVDLTAVLPSGLAVIQSSTSPTQGQLAFAGNTIHVAIGSMAGGATVGLTIMADIKQLTLQTVSATVTSDEPDIRPADNTATALVHTARPGDFDGDGKTDLAVFDPVSATFFILYSGPQGGGRTSPFGVPNHHDIPIYGDFDGDGKTDLAVFDPSSAMFFILYSGPEGGGRTMQFGNPNGAGIPIAGDYDGDGKTDLAVFDPISATFSILYSGPEGGGRMTQFGFPGDRNVPVAGDYDGDGKTDLAVYDQTNPQFFIIESGGGSKAMPFGVPNGRSLPIAGDYDGDGKTDLAVFDPVQSVFYILESGGGSVITLPGDHPNGQGIPVAGDYDGDLRTDIAVFDPVNALFAIIKSNHDLDNRGEIIQFGVPNGQGAPIPATLPGAILGIVQASDLSPTPDAASPSAPDFTRRDRRA